MNSYINDCSNKNDLIEAWEAFKGSIYCNYTKRTWNPQELIYISKDYSRYLSESGFKKGDVVALLLSNTVAFPIALMALLYMECNPLLLHVSTPKIELDRLSKIVKIKGYIHDYVDITSRFSIKKQEKLQFQIDNIILRADILSSDDTYERQINLYGAILHLTSGTYGGTKICVRNQKVAVAEAVNFVSSIDVYKNANVMVTTPLSHAFAYGFGLISSLITHSSLTLDVSFNPKKVLKLITAAHYDILIVVPPMLKTLIQLKKANTSFNMAKTVFYAGTSCAESLKNEFEDLFKVRIYTIYGSTETGGISTDYSCENKSKSVGKILKNVQVKITSGSTFKDIGDNIGEICVKSTSMMQYYYMENSSHYEEIDYFPTGDIGTISENQLSILGRKKDIINVSGIKIDPSEVEEVILSYEGITDAIVYPGRSENGDEIVLCTVSTNEQGLDIDHLRLFCTENMAHYKIPRIFNILDTIPRTASGKPLKIYLPGFPESIKESV